MMSAYQSRDETIDVTEPKVRDEVHVLGCPRCAVERVCQRATDGGAILVPGSPAPTRRPPLVCRDVRRGA